MLRTQCDEMQRLAALNDGGKPPIEYWEQLMIYFDNAATTFPKPAAVIREMTKCMKEYCGNPGRGSHPLALAAAEAIYDVRCGIADFFGISKPENVVFAQNTTQALNLAIAGIACRGDHFILSNLEHNSVLRPIANLCAIRGMTYDTVDATGDDAALLQEIERHIRPNTRAVVMTHASNICPRILPVKEIGALCKRYGILYVVDAAQSAGVYDIHMMRDGISVLCAPGHKGLYGPQGSGFAAFSDDFDFERFRCSLFGGNGKNSNDIDMGHEPPDSYEAGTVATPCIVGLGAGLRYVSSADREKIEKHETSLMRYGAELLEHHKKVKVYLPAAQRGSILLLGFDGISPSEVSEKLGDAGVCTRAGLHCAPAAHRALRTGGDALRISFSAFNTPEEIEKFVLILEKILS